MTTDNMRAMANSRLGVCLSSTGMALQNVEAAVSIVCSVIGLLIAITFSFILPVAKKIIKAKRNDGKIDVDEAADIIAELERDLKKVQEQLNNTKIDKK